MTTEQKKIARKISKNFARDLDEMKLSSIQIGTSKIMQSDWRLTLAISRHPLMKKIKEDIVNTELI